MLDKNTYEAVMRDLIYWYRELDFSEMNEEARKEILDIYIEDGNPLIKNTKSLSQ